MMRLAKGKDMMSAHLPQVARKDPGGQVSIPALALLAFWLWLQKPHLQNGANNNAKLSLEDRMVHRPWQGLWGGGCGMEAWAVSVIHILFAGTRHSLRPEA